MERERTVGWLGRVGIGKSLLQNTLLSMFESKEEYAPVLVSPTVTLADLSHSTMQGSAQVVVVTEDQAPAYYDKEREYEAHYQKWLESKCQESFTIPPFVLPSVDSFSSTTLYVTEVVGGDRYGLEVTYMTAEEIKEELYKFNFAVGAYLKRNLTSSKRYDHHILWMKELVKPSPSLKAAQRQAELEVKKELEDVYLHEIDDYIPLSEGFVHDEEYHRKFHQKIELQPIVHELSGKTLVFQGKGEDRTLDRMFIRRAFYGITMRGIFHPFDHIKDCSPAEGKFFNGTPGADLCMIKRVKVTVPKNELLPNGGVSWLDLPGCNDTDPIKTDQMIKGLERCNTVIALTEKVLQSSGDLKHLIEQFVLPRTIPEASSNPIDKILLLAVNRMVDNYVDTRELEIVPRVHDDFLQDIRSNINMPMPTPFPASLINGYLAEEEKGEKPAFSQKAYNLIRERLLEDVFQDCGSLLLPKTYLYAKKMCPEKIPANNAMDTLIALLRTPPPVERRELPRLQPEVRQLDIEGYQARLLKKIEELEKEWMEEKTNVVDIVNGVSDRHYGYAIKMFTSFRLLRYLYRNDPRLVDDVEMLKEKMGNRLVELLAPKRHNIKKIKKETEVPRLIRIMKEFVANLPAFLGEDDEVQVVEVKRVRFE